MGQELRKAIEEASSVLLFHLHNHYALISGWRELWADNLEIEQGDAGVEIPHTEPLQGGGCVDVRGNRAGEARGYTEEQESEQQAASRQACLVTPSGEGIDADTARGGAEGRGEKQGAQEEEGGGGGKVRDPRLRRQVCFARNPKPQTPNPFS